MREPAVADHQFFISPLGKRGDLSLARGWHGQTMPPATGNPSPIYQLVS